VGLTEIDMDEVFDLLIGKLYKLKYDKDFIKRLEVLETRDILDIRIQTD